jgi:elongation factor Ts
MAKFSIADITALREKTGAGMMDVKKALEEADGNVEKAIELIRIKGLKGVEKRSGRKTEEGLVAIKIVDKGAAQKGYVIELVTETDFVAKSEKFLETGDKILEAIVSADADNLDEALAVSFDDGETVKQFVEEAAARFGENVQLKSVQTIEGEKITSYLHKKAQDLPPTIAVLVVTDEKAEEAAKDVAHHIAAYSPKYFSVEDIPEEEVKKEENIATEIAKNEGKPDKIIPNIVRGRLQGFFKTVVLSKQPLAADPKVTVEEHINKTGGKIDKFLRIQVGEEKE